MNPRSRKDRARRRRREREASVQAVKEVVLEFGHVLCLGCGDEVPRKDVTSSGHCDSCTFINAISRDHHGGLGHYRHLEQYDAGSYQRDYKSIDPGCATHKPNVGNGSGPQHFLDQTPMRLSEQDIPAGLKPRGW